MVGSVHKCIDLLQKTYTERGLNILDVPKEGYHRTDITKLEKRLGKDLDSSFKQILNIVKLDRLIFGSVSFGRGTSYLEQIDWAKNRKSLFLDHTLKANDNLLHIGNYDGGILLLENHSGKIFYRDDEEFELEVIASTFQTFILLLCAISKLALLYDEDDIEDEDKLLEATNTLLDDWGYDHTRGFWKRFATRVI